MAVEISYPWIFGMRTTSWKDKFPRQMQFGNLRICAALQEGSIQVEIKRNREGSVYTYPVERGGQAMVFLDTAPDKDNRIVYIKNN